MPGVGSTFGSTGEARSRKFLDDAGALPLQGHHRRGRRSPSLPLAILFVVFALAHGPLLVGGLLLAAVIACLVMSVIVLVALGCSVATPVLRDLLRHGLPDGRTGRAGRGRPLVAPTAAGLAPDRFASGASAAGGAGPQHLYRQRLLDTLKERYVRGDISLAEFEARAEQIVRDPSARHLA